jgi:uncharacterized protein YjiS (DUF1127 family)
MERNPMILFITEALISVFRMRITALSNPKIPMTIFKLYSENRELSKRKLRDLGVGPSDTAAMLNEVITPMTRRAARSIKESKNWIIPIKTRRFLSFLSSSAKTEGICSKVGFNISLLIFI